MNRPEYTDNDPVQLFQKDPVLETQRILVFQQNGSGEGKIRGIEQYGEGLFALQIVSIDMLLPAVVDDAGEYLPGDIRADVVLDFLKHPDLSHDLSLLCADRQIPVVASGKKLRIRGTLTPPT